MADNPFQGMFGEPQENPFTGMFNNQASPARLEEDPRFQQLVETDIEQNEALEGGFLAYLGDFLSGGSQRRRGGDEVKRELADEYGMDYMDIVRRVDKVREAGGIRSFLASPEWQRDLSVAAAGGRFIGQALEPLNAAQDVAFATLEGMLDPQATIKARVGEIKLGQYFDFYDPRRLVQDRPLEFAERPTTFSEVMRLAAKQAGVEEDIPESVYTWGGVAGDILVDPLLFGTVLKGIGKASKATSLIKVGDAFEALPRTLGRTAYGVATGGPAGTRVRKAVEDRATAWTSNLLNREVPGWKPVTGQDETLGSLLFPNGRNPIARQADELTGGSGRPDFAIQSEARAQRASTELLDNVGTRIDELQAMLGRDRTRGWLQGVFSTLGLHRRIPDRLTAYPDVLRDQMVTLAWDTVDNRGVILDPEVISRLDDVVLEGRPGVSRTLADELGLARKARGDLPTVPTRDELRRQVKLGRVDVTDEAGNVTQRLETAEEALARTIAGLRETDPAQAGQALYRANIERIRKTAVEHGVDADSAERAFRDVVQKVTEADAILGFKMSLYEPIKQATFERVIANGGDAKTARRFWDRLNQEAGAGNAEIHKVNVADIFGRSEPLTVEQVMGRTGLAAQLRIGEYLQGIQSGHLRRTYAMFTDEDFFKSWDQALRRQKLIPSQFLGDKTVDALSQGGFKRESNLLQEYTSRISPTVSDERGFLVRQDRLAEYMRSQGVDQDRFDEFMTALGSQTSPALKPFLSTVRQLRAEYRTMGDAHQRFDTAVGTLAKAQARERRELSLGFLERLGQFADPEASLVQGLRGAAQQLPVNQAYADLYRHAEKAGYLRRSLDELPLDQQHLWEPIPRDAHWYGPFTGRTVPKAIKRELDNIAADKRYRQNLYQRARSAVQGGFLTGGPSTLVNVAGGFMTGAMHGINPLALARNMTAVAADFTKGGTAKLTTELREAGEILATGLSDRDFVRFAREIGQDAAGIADEKGFFKWLQDDLPKAYARFLETPLGRAERPTKAGRAFNAASAALGLKGFGFTEDLFKLGTYRLMRRAGKSQDEAIDFARQVVFDYNSQPGIVRAMRNSGIIPFPAFPYFMIGRTVDAAINRPGTLAAFTRMPEAIWNATIPDEDTKLALLAGMPDWQKRDGFAPVRVEGEDYHMIPFGQMFPTDIGSHFGHFGESLTQFGLLAPLVDIANAWGTGTGEVSDVSKRFGGRVFESDAGTSQRIGQTMQFVFNSFAPAIIRRQFNFGDPGQAPEGLIPKIVEHITSVPEELAGTQHTLHEAARGKAERDIWDQVLATFIRSPQINSLSPETATVLDTYQGEKAELDTRLGAKRDRMRQAGLDGDLDAAMSEGVELAREEAEFFARWKPRMEALLNYLKNRRE